MFGKTTMSSRGTSGSLLTFEALLPIPSIRNIATGRRATSGSGPLKKIRETPIKREEMRERRPNPTRPKPRDPEAVDLPPRSSPGAEPGATRPHASGGAPIGMGNKPWGALIGEGALQRLRRLRD
jgi:hypothetical protein